MASYTKEDFEKDAKKRSKNIRYCIDNNLPISVGNMIYGVVELVSPFNKIKNNGTSN